MTYLAPEIVSTYFVPNLFGAVSGFSSSLGDGDNPADDAG